MMDQAEVTARLNEAGLRLPDSDLAAFTDLVTDMHAAAAVAQRPLHYWDEPSNMLRLQPAKV
jgi:hypothetical protein